MTTAFLRRASLAVAATAALLAAPAQAAGFSNLVIFGDSLSDTGNLATLSPADFPSAFGPYFNGRFSDGLVWVDHLAAAYGLNATASSLGGANYAFGGARTGLSSAPPGLMLQSMVFWNGSTPNIDTTLFVVVGGGNDMRDARDTYQTNSALDAAGRDAAAANAVGQMKATVAFLAGKGAKNVLVSNLPDLGNTPEARFRGLVDASRDATDSFNDLIPGLVSYGEGLGVEMHLLDMAGVAAAVYNDALFNGGARFGLTNALAPCNGFAGSLNIPQTACDVSLFSDILHPSAAAHRLIGAAAVAAIPEPETYALMALGLGALAWRSRRRG